MDYNKLIEELHSLGFEPVERKGAEDVFNRSFFTYIEHPKEVYFGWVYRPSPSTSQWTAKFPLCWTFTYADIEKLLYVCEPDDLYNYKIVRNADICDIASLVVLYGNN